MITCGKDPPKKKTPFFSGGKTLDNFLSAVSKPIFARKCNFQDQFFESNCYKIHTLLQRFEHSKKQTFLQHFGNAFFSNFAADVPASRRVYDLSTTSHSQGPAEVRESMPRTYAFPVSFAVNCRVNFNTWRFAARGGHLPKSMICNRLCLFFSRASDERSYHKTRKGRAV